MKNTTEIVLAALLIGAFCAASAMAEVQEPKHYVGLTAFERFDPGQAPQLSYGMSNLSHSESRYQERLPMQLDGPMEKIKKAKYQRRSSQSRRVKTIRF